jgi:hypothetical protein
MNTQLEKSLIKAASFDSIVQRLANDLENFSNSLTVSLDNKVIPSRTFMDMFTNLDYEQKQFLIKIYSISSFSLLSTALNANMGATHETAAELFNFLLHEGFQFNQADLKYLKKHDNLAFKRYGSFGHVYEVTWYYPLNKWANQVKQLALKTFNKANSPIYLITFPSSNIKFALLKHYEKLPKAIQSLVLRDADDKDMEIILNKTHEGSSNDFNFFKKRAI